MRKHTDPDQYKIRIHGHLAPRWSEWFDGFKIAYDDGDTILTGTVPDQAALHGALSKIRDLGLTIDLVQREAPRCIAKRRDDPGE